MTMLHAARENRVSSRQHRMHFFRRDDTPNGVLLNEWFSLIWLNEVLFHLLYGLSLFLSFSFCISGKRDAR